MSKCDCQWLSWIPRCYGHCKPKQAQLLDLSITKDAATITKNVEEAATITEDAKEAATITNSADEAATITEEVDKAAIVVKTAYQAATDAKDAVEPTIINKDAKVLSSDSECECYGSERLLSEVAASMQGPRTLPDYQDFSQG